MMRAWLSSRFRHEQAIAMYAVVFIISVLSNLGASSHAQASHLRASQASALLYLGIGIATVWSLWQASRRAAEQRTRYAWRLLCVANALIWASGTFWTLWEELRGRELSPLVASWLGAIYVPVAVIGFLAFPKDPTVSLRDRRVQIDLALLIVGSVALSWHFGLRPGFVAADGSSLSLLTITGGWFVLVGECAVSLAASFAFVRTSSRALRLAIGFAFAGHLVYVLSDFFWTVVEATYAPGNWVDMIFFAAWLLRWTSARIALHASGPEWNEPQDLSRPRVADGLGPSMFVVSAYGVLLLALVVDSERSAVDIALVVTTLTTLLLVRQRLALAETQRVARATTAQAQRFGALLSLSSDFVLVADPAWRVTYASPSVRRLLGDLSTTTLGDVMHPDDWNGLQLALRAGDAVRSMQARVRAVDGTWRDFEYRVEDHRTDSLIGGFVVNGRDITAELALEQQLGHARKLATLSDMAGRIAHAFNNALAALLTHAELLTEELEPEAAAREDVRAIRVAAERGAGITRQLLGFSGRHVIRPERVQPAELLSALRPTLQRLLPGSIVLAIDVERDLPAVQIDRAQFEQVLLNLVANARDAMPRGGTLGISVRAHEREVTFAIADSGIGMSDVVRERIFEPFFTTKPPGRGTGLGLAMVASIVKRANGQIDVETVEGRGTRFSIRLPIPLSDPAENEPTSARDTRGTPHPLPALSSTAGAILLVDDDTPVRRATRRMLERSGYEVLEAADGATAIELIARPEVRFDALVTDLMMPGISGREVIARARTLRAFLPIVCITGYAAERSSDESLSVLVHEIVAKPFTGDALQRAIVFAISESARQRAAAVSEAPPT